MARHSKRPKSKGRPPRRPAPTATAPVDFGPLMPFLQTRLGEDHPICDAARTSDFAAFMSAVRESGDAALEHDISNELVRMAGPL